MTKTSDRPATYRENGIMQGFPPPPEARPGPANWDLPPFNRWSFQNMRKLFPTADVCRGTGPVQALDEALEDLSRLIFTTPDGRELSVAQSLLDGYTDGFMLRIGGKTVFEHYANDMDFLTPHLAQSVSKSVTSSLAGVLVGEGLLDPDAPLTEYVPELARCGYAGARVTDVLDMRSGVRFVEDYGALNSEMTRLDVASLWRPVTEGAGEETIRDLILDLKPERPHGGAFSYRSIETDVLAWALERAGGAPLAELLSDRVWQHLGCDRDGFFTVDKAGTSLADGGFNATLRDFARFGEMMRAGGRVGDKQVVPEDWVESCRSGDPSVFGAPYTMTSPNGAYRRQWWIHDVAKRDFMARGVFGQMIYIDPSRDLVAVKLSTWPDYLKPGWVPQDLAMIDAMAAALA